MAQAVDWGANVLVVETGAIPGTRKGGPGPLAGFSVAEAARLLASCGYLTEAAQARPVTLPDDARLRDGGSPPQMRAGQKNGAPVRGRRRGHAGKGGPILPWHFFFRASPTVLPSSTQARRASWRGVQLHFTKSAGMSMPMEASISCRTLADSPDQP